MANILFLRAPSPGEDDRYETTFNEAGYNVISVPVLETVLTNLADLETIVKDGPAPESIEGVIITSGRSCEAWKSVVGDLVGSPMKAGSVGWASIPFYVVGQGTAAALAEIRQTYGSTDYTPEITLGESTGTGERLAHFIRDQPQGRPKKLLYLTGDKNRDIVPTILGEAGIELRSLKVYETRGSQTFEDDLEEALKASSTALTRWWIVHFAPSAAGFVTPILKKHFKLEASELKQDRLVSSPRIAAIGTITASFLRDDLNIRVDAVPVKPTPQDLLAAITSYDEDPTQRSGT